MKLIHLILPLWPGIVAGIFAGLSISPVIGTIIALIISTSAIALGFIPEKKLAHSSKALSQLSIFSIGLLLGSGLGIYVRVNHVFYDIHRSESHLREMGFTDPKTIRQLILSDKNGLVLKESAVIEKTPSVNNLSVMFGTEVPPKSVIDEMNPNSSSSDEIMRAWLETQSNVNKYGIGWSEAAKAAEFFEDNAEAEGTQKNEEQTKQLLNFYWKVIQRISEHGISEHE